MNLISLDDLDAPITKLGCDVCIVGAGAAGLYLAHKLERMGLSVVLLEAGPRVCVDGSAIGIEASFTTDTYHGAMEGRAFGLGGTTSRWGGLLVPYRNQDLRSDNDLHTPAWRHILAVVRKYSASVADSLGLEIDPAAPVSTVPGAPAIEQAIEKTGLMLAASTWLPFRHRHFAFLGSNSRGGKNAATVYLGAVASDWQVAEVPSDKARLRSVGAIDGKGRQLVVSAHAFVIAAGAIESSRILQEINLANGGCVICPGAAIGRYLSDHLSCRIAEVASTDRIQAINTFGPRFMRDLMRTFRIIERTQSADQPRYFAHFLFDNHNPGFHLVRRCLQGLQARRIPRITFGDVLAGTSGLACLAYSRWIRSRLYIPSGTRTFLQLDMEQWPSHDNAVLLGDETDRFGRPTAVVNWRITDCDLASLEKTSSRFLSLWADQSAGPLRLTALRDQEVGLKPHDAYHPVGTCRLGEDREAVVDPGLLVHGTENLFVLSTAIFPSAGTANPTFSMLCFAEALGDRLHKEAIA